MARARKDSTTSIHTMVDWWRGKGLACPPHLRSRLEEAVDERHFHEVRFLAVVGILVAIASLVLDFITIPDFAVLITTVRLMVSVPLFCAVLIAPRENLGLQKALLGLGLCALALTLLFASGFAGSPSDAFMAIGVILLFGLAIPLLPFRRRGMLLFIVGAVVPTSLMTLWVHGEGEFSRTFLTILALTAVGAGILSRRMRWLEKQTVLLTLQAEDRANELEQSNRRLTQLSMQDPLTNLANRRWAEIAFERDYALSVKEAPGYTALLLLDLDHFKDFNDRWGHDAGDKCLQAVAEVLRHVASTHGGMAARFGGEEFVVLLRTGGLSQALDIAEELRLGVERIEMVHGGSLAAISCTTSIGVAVHESEGKPQLSNLLKRADAALYEAKRDGRNRHKLAA